MKNIFHLELTETFYEKKNGKVKQVNKGKYKSAKDKSRF